MKANFLEIHSAADYIGPGAIEVPMYQSEITDIVRRRGAFGQRIRQVPATGHPSRFFRRDGHSFAGHLRLCGSAEHCSAPVVTPSACGALRAAQGDCGPAELQPVRCGAWRTQQKQFAYLQAKDLLDTVDGVMRSHDVALWNGSDTSLSTPTTAQYYGAAAAQIAAGGNVVTIGTSANITDGLKSTQSRRWWPARTTRYGRQPSMQTRCCWIFWIAR